MLGTGSYVTQAGLNLSVDVTKDDFNLLIPLPPRPECWEHGHVPPRLTRRIREAMRVNTHCVHELHLWYWEGERGKSQKPLFQFGLTPCLALLRRDGGTEGHSCILSPPGRCLTWSCGSQTCALASRNWRKRTLHVNLVWEATDEAKRQLAEDCTSLHLQMKKWASPPQGMLGFLFFSAS